MVAHVPVKVPDQYAALAQEEKRFTHVTPPRLSHAVVAIADTNNSSSESGQDGTKPSMRYLTVSVPSGLAAGGIQVFLPDPTNPSISDTSTCTTACNYAFPLGPDGQPTPAGVVIGAYPASAGSTFSQWRGCTDPWRTTQDEPDPEAWCTVHMTAGDVSVSADFVPAAQLTLDVSPSGGGIVTSPYGIYCGGTGELGCSWSYATGSTVTLTAASRPGWAVASWTGCDQVSDDTCTVTMNQAKNVTANYAPVSYPLNVTVTGQTGTVTSSPGGIDCGTTCSASFGADYTVTLTATPGQQSALASWTGCDQVSGNTCTVTMNQTKNVTANFVPVHQLTVTLQTNLAGHTGTVTSSPAGIDCGTACSANFADGSTVTLTAADAPQAIFVSWSGCDQVSGKTCTVTMNQAKNVVANYA